jgi:peptidoglycan/LPS O-acetylase OafA/YrhL
MSVGNPLPYFLINALCLAVACLVLARSSFYRSQVAGTGRGRFEMIDGLRGWLALGVFFTHAANSYFYHAEGKWDSSSTPFYQTTGYVGVALFFMITAFLFWSRVLAEDGRTDIAALYRSRVRRIVPMYIASVLMVMLIVAAITGFSLKVSPVTLLKQLRGWFSFGFAYAGPLNGFEDAHMINAVYWTLAFEWMFYLSLPFLSLFSRWPLFILLFGLGLYYGNQAPVTLNFLFGALAAVLARQSLFGRRLTRRWIALVPLAALCTVFYLKLNYGIAFSVLLFVFFVFVVAGNSFFGVLRWRGSRFLGCTSYSIYLVHCLVLFVAIRALDAYVPVASLDPLQYWAAVAVIAAGVVLLSAVTYRFVEYPFISRNRRPAEEGKPGVCEKNPAEAGLFVTAR